MAGLPRLPRLPREGAAKVRLPRVQRDRHDVPRLLVETSEGVEAFLDFLMKPEQASTLTRGTWAVTGRMPYLYFFLVTSSIRWRTSLNS